MADVSIHRGLSRPPGPLSSRPPEEPDFIPDAWRETPRPAPPRAPISIPLLVAVFAIGWLWMGGGYLREALRLAQAGPQTSVPATILFAARVPPGAAGEPGSGRVDVRYDDAGVPRTGFVRVTEASLESYTPGGSMRIWPDEAFLVQLPLLLTNDGLDTVDARKRAAFLSGAPVFVGGLLGLYAVVTALRRRRLLARGRVGTGKILAVGADWSTLLTTVPFGVAGEKLLAVRYRFQSTSGPIEATDRVFHFRGAPGQSVVVVYDQDAPSRSLLYAVKSDDGTVRAV